MPRTRNLDRAAVIQAAARIANVGGLEALTINRLAGELGIQPPSLYNHIGGLAAVRRELALLSNQVLAERLSAAALARSGPAAFSALAQAYRAYIKECPGQYAASLPASGARPQPDLELAAAEQRVLEIVLAVVGSFGLVGADALHAVRGLRSVVHGFATLEIAGGFGLPLDCDESFARLVEMLGAGMKREARVEKRESS